MHSQVGYLNKPTQTASTKNCSLTRQKMNVKKEDRATIEFILDILIISSGIISLDTYLMASSINTILGQ